MLKRFVERVKRSLVYRLKKHQTRFYIAHSILVSVACSMLLVPFLLLAVLLRILGVFALCRRWHAARHPKSVLFFSWSTRKNASSRLRIYNVARFLEDKGWRTGVSAPFSERMYDEYMTAGPYHFYGLFIVYWVTFFNRVKEIITKSLKYRCIVIQRELFTLQVFAPPVLEIFLSQFNPNLVIDFDDYIFSLPPHSLLGKNRFANFFSTFRASTTLKLCKHAIVGNQFLKAHSEKYNADITIIPTCVDTRVYKVKEKKPRESIVLGWIGNEGNLFYLDHLKSVFEQLSKKYDRVVLRVVCSAPFETDGMPVENVEWDMKTETEEVQDFDIGLMPLTDNDYTRGKCAYKILQYFGGGVPAVCSPVAMNADVVTDGKTGFTATTDEEWVDRLSTLIVNAKLRKTLGENGRRLVCERYSYENNIDKYVKIFESLSQENHTERQRKAL